MQPLREVLVAVLEENRDDFTGSSQIIQSLSDGAQPLGEHAKGVREPGGGRAPTEFFRHPHFDRIQPLECE